MLPTEMPIRDHDDFTHAGDIAQAVLAEIQINVKDRADEARDSMRVHNGMTLDEFLATQ
jgi:hypothetical protein